MAAEPSTHVSLLVRLRQTPTDEHAWCDFLARYGPMLQGWCRHWGLQEADAEDVTQAVLLALAARLKTFTYDPSLRFRGWLRTVARHAWSAFVEQQQRGPRGRGDSDWQRILAAVEAREDFLRRFEDEFDHELLELAMQRVRVRVEAHTWEAFRLLALEQQPAAAVAERLSMKIATVYVARSKVQKLIRAEVRQMEEESR